MGREGLLDLAQRVEAAPEGDWTLDLEIGKALGRLDYDKMTTSLDAATTLTPAPDWEWSLEWEAGESGKMIAIAKFGDPLLHMEAQAATPALALCAAALRARATQAA